mgnify:CR=1 FL=1
MGLSLITAPTIEPITNAELWDHLRLNLSGSPEQPTTREMNSAAQCLSAAVALIDGRDGILNRCLVPQTWELTMDEFPFGDLISIPLSPVVSIESIKYTDVNGAEQTFSASSYSLSRETYWRPMVILGYNQTWPSTRVIEEAVRIRFVAGFTSGNSPEDATAVPKSLKQFILLMAGHYFESREATVIGTIATELPLGAKYLINPFMNKAVG